MVWHSVFLWRNLKHHVAWREECPCPDLSMIKLQELLGDKTNPFQLLLKLIARVCNFDAGAACLGGEFYGGAAELFAKNPCKVGGTLARQC